MTVDITVLKARDGKVSQLNVTHLQALAQIRYIIGGECIWKDEDIQRAFDSGATVNEVINDILDGRFQPPPPSHSRDVSSLERMDIHVSRKIDVIEIDSDSCNSPERVIPDSPRTSTNTHHIFRYFALIIN